MINPHTITNFNRTQEELEEFLLFAIMVAGKSSDQTAKKLEKFLLPARAQNLSPFDWIQSLVDQAKPERNYYPLSFELMRNRVGQYIRIDGAFTGVLAFKNRLDKVSLAELEGVFGVGPKTARFFLLHSRPNLKFGVLDTHILKWMSEQGYRVPKSTPSGKRYLQLEKQFLDHAANIGISIADLDLQIWSGKVKTKTK
jgi:hypothetical protein